MRVAIHSTHPETGEPVVGTFRGRIEGGFTNPITGEEYSREQVAEGWLKLAQEANPDCTIVLERLVDNGDGTAAWIKAEDVTEDTPLAGGAQHEQELSAEQAQQTTGGE